MMNAFRSGCSPIIGSSLKIGAMSAPLAAGEREADSEGEAVDHVHVDALQGRRFLVLLDGAHGGAEPGPVDEEVQGDHQGRGDRG